MLSQSIETIWIFPEATLILCKMTTEDVCYVDFYFDARADSVVIDTIHCVTPIETRDAAVTADHHN